MLSKRLLCVLRANLFYFIRAHGIMQSSFLSFTLGSGTATAEVVVSTATAHSEHHNNIIKKSVSVDIPGSIPTLVIEHV